MTDINFLDELFYSTEIWGYLGPLFMVFVGYHITRKDKTFGGFYFVVLAIMSVTYFAKFDTNPAFIWHALILLFGGVFVCVYPQFSS